MGIRESILAAGTQLLREQGIGALSQPKVAAAAGIKQSHLTYYFPTRADLLMGITEQAITAMLASLEAKMTESPRHATLAATISEVMIEGIPPRAVIGLIAAADVHPEIRKPLRKLIRQVREHILALLTKAGLAANEETALLFHAVMVGLAIMHQARQNRESASEIKDGVAAMLRLLEPAVPDPENHPL